VDVSSWQKRVRAKVFGVLGMKKANKKREEALKAEGQTCGAKLAGEFLNNTIIHFFEEGKLN